MAKEANGAPIAGWKTPANGHLSKDANGDDKTDYSRWRLHDNDGRLTWRYLQSDEENEKWPQTTYDKYHLGLPTVSQCADDLERTTLTSQLGPPGAAKGQNASPSGGKWVVLFFQSPDAHRSLGM